MWLLPTVWENAALDPENKMPNVNVKKKYLCGNDIF